MRALRAVRSSCRIAPFFLGPVCACIRVIDCKGSLLVETRTLKTDESKRSLPEERSSFGFSSLSVRKSPSLERKSGMPDATLIPAPVYIQRSEEKWRKGVSGDRADRKQRRCALHEQRPERLQRGLPGRLPGCSDGYNLAALHYHCCCSSSRERCSLSCSHTE